MTELSSYWPPPANGNPQPDWHWLSLKQAARLKLCALAATQPQKPAPL
jgi:hypothetical protein